MDSPRAATDDDVGSAASGGRLNFEFCKGSDVMSHGCALWACPPSHNLQSILKVEILLDTLRALETPKKRRKMRDQAQNNLERWAKNVDAANEPPEGKTLLIVEEDDWGDVAHRLTKRFGKIFAVLNMANAYHFGGAYTGGASAQEENMFRRTDCHFHDELLGPGNGGKGRKYPEDSSALINGEGGRVYLGERPCVCIRGKEQLSKPFKEIERAEELGYKWLPDDEVFPFLELRAAALDLRSRRLQGSQQYSENCTFSMEACRKRIDAQLDTLAGKGVKHVVLGAFGCGAFENPTHLVAKCYREALEARPAEEFQVVAFAIYHAGYGPRNFGPFASEMSQLSCPRFAREIKPVRHAHHDDDKSQ